MTIFKPSFQLHALFVLPFFLSMSHQSTRALAAPTPEANTTVSLIENKVPLSIIVVAEGATPEETNAAQELQLYLQKISGATVEIAHRPDGKLVPIYIGEAASTPELLTAIRAKGSDPASFVLQVGAGEVRIVGLSPEGTLFGTYELLEQLGVRWFLPGEVGTVIPQSSTLALRAQQTVQVPSFAGRWMNAGRNFPEWGKHVRMGGPYFPSAHGIPGLKDKKLFETHPEYFALVNGKRTPRQADVSNPEVIRIAVEGTKAFFRKNPDALWIGMGPNDGSGFCECERCQALDGGDWDAFSNERSVTDRYVWFFNQVMNYPNPVLFLTRRSTFAVCAFSATFLASSCATPGKNASTGPSLSPLAATEPSTKAVAQTVPAVSVKLAVHPRVVVGIATGFIRGGYSIDELLAGWNEKASLLGIREYYSVHPWDRDLPGRARGANTKYLGRTLPDFHGKKARFMSAESSDNWGPNGLGFYIASRLMWDVNEAKQIDELTSDFLTRAFGTAAEPMANFYRSIDGANKPLLSTDLIGRMYQQLDQALKLTKDDAVRARLHNLALYTRYVEMFSAYTQAAGPARQAAFEAVLRFGWRIRHTQLIHTLALWRDLPNRDKQVKVPQGADYRTPEPQNPWKSSEEFTSPQIAKFIADGIANNQTIEFEAVSFSNELVPATALGLTSNKLGNFNMLRGNQDFYTWVEKAPATISLQSSSGLIYNNRGDAQFLLFPENEPAGESVAQAGVEPSKEVQDIRLATSIPGLQRINVSDGTAGTTVSWAEGTPMTVEASLTSPPRFAGGRWSMYFYVPKGTKVVGGYRNGIGQLADATGKVVMKFAADGNPGYWSVPVAPGQDGKLWSFPTVSGQMMLMTVPPYLARSAQELLLPKEVVASDAAK